MMSIIFVIRRLCLLFATLGAHQNIVAKIQLLLRRLRNKRRYAQIGACCGKV